MENFRPTMPTQIMPGQMVSIIPQAPEMDAELKANLELAKAASDARFLLIVGKQVKWAQDRGNTPAAIASDEDYTQAVVVAQDMGSTLKSLDEIRLSYVAFPTRVIDMINGLFRQTRRSIEENRTWLQKLIAKRDYEKEQARARELEEARRLNEVQVVQVVPPAAIASPVGNGEVSKVHFVEVGEPENSVSSTKGVIPANVHDFDVVVTDKVEFMKLLVSKAATQIWITEHASELVTVNVERLKQLLRENPGKRKVAGCRIDKR